MIKYICNAKMNKLNRCLASFLLVVLSFYIVPKEFVHAFSGHEDTTHHHSFAVSGHAPFIGNRHVHCDLLNFETSFFFSQYLSPVSAAEGFCFSYIPLFPNAAELGSLPLVTLRGPPLC